MTQVNDLIARSINLKDNNFSSWIYERNYQLIDLERKELEVSFMQQILTNETIISLCDKYLTLLKKCNEEKFIALKHGDRFVAEEVFEEFSNDLKKDYSQYATVFKAHEEIKYKIRNEKDYLSVMLEQPYFKAFCDGLELTYSERCFFLLNIANREWRWLFPSKYSEEYKTKLFTSICLPKKSTNTIITRKLNNSMIAKGLFYDEWEVQNYVFEFFCGKVHSFFLHKTERNFLQTLYDYDDITDLNNESLKIIEKQLDEYLKNQKSCKILFTGISDFTTGLYLSFFSETKKINLYEVEQQIEDADKKEMMFYLYALSVMLNGKRKVLYLDRANTEKLIASYENEGNTIRLVNNARSGSLKLKQRTSFNYFLSEIKIPILLSTDQNSAETKESLDNIGLDILFSTELRLPAVKDYKRWVGNFFYEKKIPEKLFCVAVDICDELKIQPEKWDKVVAILNNATKLSCTEAAVLLKNKFGKTDTKAPQLRKNSHYCIEALNTTESVQDLIKAVKNAEEYHEHEYDEESGIRICLTGPSGTGKTAFAEETAKEIGRPLHIVRASDILDSFVGQTEKNIRTVFERAAEEHAVLLIDEADSFIHERGDKVNHHNDSKVNEFLVQMERFPGILFCNTNLPDILDKATDRRFHFKVGFKPLTKEGVGLLCKSYFERFNLTEDQVSKIYSSGDVTPGDFSALNGKLRFMDKSMLNAEYITNELCAFIRGKERSYDNKTIGFSI